MQRFDIINTDGSRSPYGIVVYNKENLLPHQKYLHVCDPRELLFTVNIHHHLLKILPLFIKVINSKTVKGDIRNIFHVCDLNKLLKVNIHHLYQIHPLLFEVITSQIVKGDIRYIFNVCDLR